MQTSPWIKILTLVFFFGAMISFVAFRSGVFDPSPKRSAIGPESSVPDSPSVAKPGSEHMIYSTKSGKIIEPAKQESSTPQIMPSSKSMIMVEPTSTKQSAPVMPDSVKQTRVKQQPAKSKVSKQKAKPKNKTKVSNNNNVNMTMPSSKSGPVLPTH